jgi:hypothetical protein
MYLLLPLCSWRSSPTLSHEFWAYSTCQHWARIEIKERTVTLPLSCLKTFTVSDIKITSHQYHRISLSIFVCFIFHWSTIYIQKSTHTMLCAFTRSSGTVDGSSWVCPKSLGRLPTGGEAWKERRYLQTKADISGKEFFSHLSQKDFHSYSALSDPLLLLTIIYPNCSA